MRAWLKRKRPERCTKHKVTVYYTCRECEREIEELARKACESARGEAPTREGQ